MPTRLPLRPPSFAAKYAAALAVLIVAAGTYLAVERLAERAAFPQHDLMTRLDERIPFLPWTVWLYMPAWIAFFHVVVALVQSWRTLWRGVATISLASVIAYAVFVFLPASYPRPPLDGADVDGATRALLSAVRAIDLPNNTFPSLHVALSFSVALAVRREHRVRGAALLILALVPSLATLTVKQHYVVDIIGGVVLACAAHASVYGLATVRAPSRAWRAGRAVPRARGSARSP